MAPSVAWDLYVCGNSTQGVPPLRLLRRGNARSEKQYRQLNQMQNVMKPLADDLRDKGLWVSNPSLAQAHSMYDAAAPTLNIANETLTGKARRPSQLTWKTVVNDKKLRIKLASELGLAPSSVNPVAMNVDQADAGQGHAPVAHAPVPMQVD
jgi:phage terminase small subunit